MNDHRPHFPNHVRDLAPELVRIAVLVITIGPAENEREASEKTVAGCEGSRRVIPTREDAANA